MKCYIIVVLILLVLVSNRTSRGPNDKKTTSDDDDDVLGFLDNLEVTEPTLQEFTKNVKSLSCESLFDYLKNPKKGNFDFHLINEAVSKLDEKNKMLKQIYKKYHDWSVNQGAIYDEKDKKEKIEVYKDKLKECRKKFKKFGNGNNKKKQAN